jgi:acyl-CoA synthetase (AMP-forming)/AMP-acid ligase II
MMLQNHPTFYIALFAISKLGAIPSLINTNLVDQSLLHCIKVAESKLFLFDPVYEKQVATVLDNGMNVKFAAYGESTELSELAPFPFAPTLTPNVLADYSDRDTSEEPLKGVKPSDAAYLIYTR